MSSKKIQLSGGLVRVALVGTVLIGVVAGAMVLARRGPSVLAQATAAQSPAQYVPLQIGAANDAPAPVAKRTSVGKPRATGRAATTPAAKPLLVMASAPTPAVEAPADAVVQPLEVITLTGCLQHDDGTFQLKDTVGTDAPKARSWKSGFLKKHAASVQVVDSANRFGLPTHVGQKVTVTGVLLNKEMRARAVQRVGVCS